MRRVAATLKLLTLVAASHAAFDANVFVPRTSLEHAWDVGVRAHTDHVIYVGPEFFPGHVDPLLAELMNPRHGPSTDRPPMPAGYHPTDFQGAYGDNGSGSGVIAVVDTYDYPTSLADFNTFASTFGLPIESSSNPTAAGNSVFQVVYAAGSQPAADGGWSQEMALDIEWAHAMAPGAKIVLVEAASPNFTDLFQAVDVAASLPGVTQVSLSWGGSEFNGESAYDSHFNHPGVTFFVSSGDTGGAETTPRCRLMWSPWGERV